jgi:bifunctional oxygenase/reductase
MSRLLGKTALVTGSSQGIGRGIASRLACDGALVIVHYSASQTAADDTVTSIEREGGRAFAVRAELGVPGDVHNLFLAVEQGLKERTGRDALDILVNNAAFTGRPTPPEDITPEQFDRYYAVNARAPFFIVQRALTLMGPGGRIINITSGLTRGSEPMQVPYAMSKGAIEQLTQHMAKLAGSRGITINNVAPGITNNGHHPAFSTPERLAQVSRLSPFNRVGEVEDIADVVAFLASDEARWITGAFVDASGGMLLGA